MINLQLVGTTVADARGTFDIILETFPELDQYLVQDADIVHKPECEVAICKVVNGKGSELFEYQIMLLQDFEIPNQ
ncbi:hypothetical protein GQ600_8328 [Phytophthora cactorum]|nr:hypothetical protein GQ600_8328 [Phytophthora cactorum]